jgi:hypothetical protein
VLGFPSQTIDEQTVLSYTPKVPAALLKEQVDQHRRIDAAS